jgi:hypothetical protein
LIIVIEGVNLFVEQNHGWENDLKFWLPRELPPRVKVILTIEEGSHNISYLRKIGCKFLHIGSDKHTQLELLSSFDDKVFYSSQEFKKNVFRYLQEELQGGTKLTSGFVKSKVN